MLANESSNLNPECTALPITQSASKSGSSAFGAIPVEFGEQTREALDHSEIYCSTERHKRSHRRNGVTRIMIRSASHGRVLQAIDYLENRVRRL